ncbi:unnamed protein product [Soboliphyme baturini]|uniref:N-terminal Ras-GEF domain-containing protein n=1 Tax=Soboliphyme baturini TaxID=241478 RepID=A0A183J5K8_9BILA|nr:unnamed protein product [Soboliphyme baturini]
MLIYGNESWDMTEKSLIPATAAERGFLRRAADPAYKYPRILGVQSLLLLIEKSKLGVRPLDFVTFWLPALCYWDAEEKGSTDGSSSTCGGTSGVGTSLDDSLHALLENILPRKDYMPDKSQIFTFLLSARMFCSPAELLQEILQHCIYEQNSAGVNYRKDLRTKFARSVVHFLLEWVVSFPYDFLDSKMSERLNEFLDICCCVSIMKKCPEASLLAQQLTHIEMERMSMIGPEEFVYYCLAKKPCPQVSKENTCQRRVTHNIDHYLEWCNRLTYLVATEICRVKAVKTNQQQYFVITTFDGLARQEESSDTRHGVLHRRRKGVL